MATVPSPAELRYQQDRYDDSEVPELIASNVLCLCLAFTAVGLRFVCRRMIRITYQWDDWLIVAGLVFATAVIICQFIGIRYGAGRHTVVMTSTTTSLRGFERTLLAVEVIYQGATFCIKASILYLYHRVFFVSRRFTITLCAVAIFIFIYSSVQGLGALIECVPLNADWDPQVKRHCFPVNAAVTVFAICNVLTDVTILILPMPLLWGLNQPLEQRVKLMGMFALGGFVCFASIYRAVIIHNLSRKDASYDDIPSQVWTGIEMGTGVVSVCLPTYRPIFKILIPKVKTKFASMGGGWGGGDLAHIEDGDAPEKSELSEESRGDSDLGAMREHSEPSEQSRGNPTSDLELRRKRSKPSQSSEFAHIGLFGKDVDLEQGSKEVAEVAIKPV